MEEAAHCAAPLIRSGKSPAMRYACLRTNVQNVHADQPIRLINCCVYALGGPINAHKTHRTIKVGTTISTPSPAPSSAKRCFCASIEPKLFATAVTPRRTSIQRKEIHSLTQAANPIAMTAIMTVKPTSLKFMFRCFCYF